MKFFKIIAPALLIFLSTAAMSGEKELFDLARGFYAGGEYYSAITEVMRYQHLYPSGKYYPASLLLMGKAYYRGENYGLAVQAFTTGFSSYKDTPEGEESLFLLGKVRLLEGSPFFAVKTLQEYRYVYGKGIFDEPAALDLSRAYALIADFDLALEGIKKYREGYPSGKLGDDALALEKIVQDEMNRPQKSILTAMLGSLALPGFGHFYTGNIANGALSLLSNVVLIFLTYDGYRSGNRPQMFFFGLTEFIFYQYSLAGAAYSVQEYNSREPYYKRVRLGITAGF